MKMLKTTLLFAALLTLFSADRVCNHPEQSFVYICDSTGATKYHLTSDCRGLNACSQKIIKVTKEEAYDQGKKTLCGFED